MSAPSDGQSKLSPLDMGILGGAIALNFYWMISYTGPFQWLAELQLKWWESYTEKLTFVITFMVTYGLLALLTWPMRKIIKSGSDLGQKFDAFGRWGIFAIVGLALAVMGARDWYRAATAGDLTVVSLEQLEAGRPPASTWCSISGFAVEEASVTFSKGRGSVDKYVPVISAVEEASKTGIHLFLKMREKEIAAGSMQEPATFEGMIFHNDLPGPLRVALERENAIRGDDYYVMEMGATPATKVKTARVLVYIAGGVFVLCIGAGIFQVSRRRASASS